MTSDIIERWKAWA